MVGEASEDGGEDGESARRGELLEEEEEEEGQCFKSALTFFRALSEDVGDEKSEGGATWRLTAAGKELGAEGQSTHFSLFGQPLC